MQDLPDSPIYFSGRSIYSNASERIENMLLFPILPRIRVSSQGWPWFSTAKDMSSTTYKHDISRKRTVGFPQFMEALERQKNDAKSRVVSVEGKGGDEGTTQCEEKEKNSFSFIRNSTAKTVKNY